MTSDNNTDSPPFYQFYRRLVENNFQIGLGEYWIFIRAVEEFVGLNIKEFSYLLNLSRDKEFKSDFFKNYSNSLIKSLWLKPNQSQQLFDELFEESYKLYYSFAQKKSEPAADTNTTVPTDKDKIEKDQEIKDPVVKTDALKPETIEDKEESIDRDVKIRISTGKSDNNDLIDLRGNVEKSKFLFAKKFYPIDRRQILQNLKPLAAFRQQNETIEIDFDLTIKKITEKGVFTEAVFKKRKKNETKLLLLIDNKGSMIAFEQLTNILKNELEKTLGILHPKKDETMKTFYFKNVPNNYFYKDTIHMEYEEINKTMNHFKNKSALIIILSDAGAARGSRNSERINKTEEFLSNLRKNCSGRIAWINPLPKERWSGNSAGKISGRVAMFEANEKGIKNVVNLLKGRSISKNY